jgi:hypothetical protein
MKAFARTAVLAAVTLLAACAEDRIPDPIDRDPPPPPPSYDLTTETGAAQALATMLAARDTAAVRLVLDPGATLQLEPNESATFNWPVTDLLARELRLGLIHLLTGLPVSSPDGILQPGVDSVRVSRWDLGIPFHDAPAGSLYPGTRESGYRVEVTAYADGDTLVAPIAGWLMVHVHADTVAGAPVHHVVGLRDLTGEDFAPAIDAPTLGRVLIDYLANRTPVVVVTADPASGPPGTHFALDAATSHDPEGSPLEFRWRIGDVERPWTYWSSAAAVDTVFSTPATLSVTVVARDRWLLEGAGFTTITILP